MPPKKKPLRAKEVAKKSSPSSVSTALSVAPTSSPSVFPTSSPTPPLSVAASKRDVAPPGMVTVYIDATPLYARPAAVAALGLQEIRLGPAEGSVYVFPAQKEGFEKARDEAAASGKSVGFFDYVVAGAGLGFGATLGSAAAEGALGLGEDAIEGMFGSGRAGSTRARRRGAKVKA